LKHEPTCGAGSCLKSLPAGDRAAMSLRRPRRPRFDGAEGWPAAGWQHQGAVFEIVDLNVSAGNDVAFAHALLRCGTPELEKNPANLLRLSIGLRKQSGRWVVSHAHHSFPSP
jgi:ketosteroid isomerase-like protein